MGLHIPSHISDFLDEDRRLHYRTKGQHVLYILDRYMKETIKNKNGGRNTLYPTSPPKRTEHKESKDLSSKFGIETE
jgi:hypothetical protein